MKRFSKQQKGGSAIVNIIMIAVLAYGVFVGIQYAPQTFESRSIKSVLNSIRDIHKKQPVTSVRDAKSRVSQNLYLSDIDYMKDSLTVRQVRDKIVIKFSWERELNLIYKQKQMQYEHSLTLD